MKNYNLNKKNSGMSLPITFMFILASSGFVFAFYNKMIILIPQVIFKIKFAIKWVLPIIRYVLYFMLREKFES